MTQEIQKFVVNGDVVEVIQWKGYNGTNEFYDFIEEWSNNRVTGLGEKLSGAMVELNVPVNGEFEVAESNDYIMKRVKDGSMFLTDAIAFERFKETFDVAE